MTNPRFFTRAGSAIAAALLALATPAAHAVPTDFSDDFNDGFLGDAWLLDQDGDLTTTVDQVALPVWFVNFGSAAASNATLIDLREDRRRGRLRFRAPRNNVGLVYSGYSSYSPVASQNIGTPQGWLLDPADALDNPLDLGVMPNTPTITLREEVADQIQSEQRTIGRPDNFDFSIDAVVAHRSGVNPGVDPVAFTPRAQGLAIVLADADEGVIGYNFPDVSNLVGTGVEIFIENTAAPSLTFGIRRFENGALADQTGIGLPPGEKFDGRIEVDYDNFPLGTPDLLTVTYIDRLGRRTPISLGNVFRIPNTDTDVGSDMTTGACCFEDDMMPTGMCIDGLSAVACESAGGEFRGTDSSCMAGNCTNDPMAMPLIGACCLGDGTCMEIDAIACATMNATYQGDNTGCVGACVDGGTDDGEFELVQFLDVNRVQLWIGAYSERPQTRINPRNFYFEAFSAAAFTYQLDGNLNRSVDPDVDGNGIVNAVDVAAALELFPAASTQLLGAALAGAGGPTPADFLRERQFNRAVGRWYRQNVQPLFAGERSQRERRADRRRLQETRPIGG